MAIRSGGGKRSNKPENATFVPPGRLRPKKPYLPVGDPFPQNPGFALGHYKVVSEHDDYVVCNGYDPNAKDPFAEITPDAFREIKVAKPPELQKTILDGDTETIDGVDYTYEYTDIGVRKAHWTNSAGSQLIEQRIDVPYKVDDLLVAVEIKKNAAVRGMEVTDEDGVRLRWIDLNVSGRHWESQTVRYAKLTADLAAASSFLSGAATAAAVFVDESGTPGTLAATTDTFVVTNRWVDLSLSSGKYLVVQKIGSEWVIVASECP